MRNLLRYLGADKRKQGESGPKEITPADRVRLAHEKLERAPTGTIAGTIESIPVDRDGICESCGRPLKPDSRILGIEHCPTCDGPFSRRVLMRWLMAAFWGAAWAFGLSVVVILKNGYIPDIPGFWMFPLFLWALFTLGIALHKILPESHGGGFFGGGGGFSGGGGSFGGGGASGGW